MARKIGWQSEEKKQKLAENEEKGNAITDSINTDKTFDPKSYKPEEPIDYEFPHDCNLLNQLSGLMCASTTGNSKAATTQAVIALAALIASRKYLTPDGDSCNLYVSTVAAQGASATELYYTMRGIYDILRACDMQSMIRRSQPTSPQQLYKTLYQSPSSLYVCDDFVDMIKQSPKQSSGSTARVLNLITQIRDIGKELELDSIEDLGMRVADLRQGDNQLKPVIYYPCFSMLSLVSYDKLPTLTKSGEIGRGSLGQFLLAICDIDDMEYKSRKTQIKPDSAIINNLLRIRGFNRTVDEDGKVNTNDSALADAQSNLPSILKELKTVTFEGNDAEIEKYDQMIYDAVKDPRKNRFLIDVARSNMRRLMTILAAFSNKGDLVATKSIMEWSAKYVIKQLKRLIDVLEVVSGDDGKMDVYQSVIHAILTQGKEEGLPASYIQRHSKPFRNLPKEKKQEIIDGILSSGEVIIRKIPHKKTGVFYDSLIHWSFIEKTQPEPTDL